MGTTFGTRPAASAPSGATIDWSRLTPLGGIVFFILLVVAFLASGGTPPNVDDSVATITRYGIQHHTGILISDFVNALGTIFFLVFLGSIWKALRAAEASGAMSVVAVAAGTVGAAGALIGSTVEAALTFQAVKLGDPGLVRALFDLNRFVFLFIWFPLGTLIGVTSLAAIRTAFLPRWLGWAGAVTAAVMFLSTLGVFADKPNLIAALGLIAFILFALWILAASIVLYMRAPTPPDLARAAD